MIVDGLAFLFVAIALAAVVAGYERNLPDPSASPALVAAGAPAWTDPETTGSITPVAGPVARWADAQPPFARPESDRAAGGAWVSPPRR
ncbi:hypothetical protein LOK46_19800 [Methylobacterium sp. NMS14P]|uniref:hypothetical protein n=1 Tax=Methylobacterium sp. NMS14P TaxID=2894310 RepID=UPI002358181E|nr:hypothetical protein [Methylobacterium sp. NMS14P]WCS23406.1 hypothetical protein LOK46_19800 [Methylobacterium sp. NMS14P]